MKHLVREYGKRSSSIAILPWSMCTKFYQKAESSTEFFNMQVMQGFNSKRNREGQVSRFALRDMQERMEIRMPKPWEEWERYASGWPSNTFDGPGTKSIAIERSPAHSQVGFDGLSFQLTSRILPKFKSCLSLRKFSLVLCLQHCWSAICFGKTQRATFGVQAIFHTLLMLEVQGTRLSKRRVPIP